MSLMRAELEQVVPTISQNPFLKNDQKRLGKSNSLIPSFRALKEKEPLDESKEEIVIEREHSVQRDCLKQELHQVIKGIKEIGSEGFDMKTDDDTTKENQFTDVTVDCEDIELEERSNINIDINPSERSSSSLSDTSDITLVLEDGIEEQEGVWDNTLE